MIEKRKGVLYVPLQQGIVSRAYNDTKNEISDFLTNNFKDHTFYSYRNFLKPINDMDDPDVVFDGSHLTRLREKLEEADIQAIILISQDSSNKIEYVFKIPFLNTIGAYEMSNQFKEVQSTYDFFNLIYIDSVLKDNESYQGMKSLYKLVSSSKYKFYNNLNFDYLTCDRDMIKVTPNAPEEFTSSAGDVLFRGINLEFTDYEIEEEVTKQFNLHDWYENEEPKFKYKNDLAVVRGNQIHETLANNLKIKHDSYYDYDCVKGTTLHEALNLKSGGYEAGELPVIYDVEASKMIFNGADLIITNTIRDSVGLSKKVTRKLVTPNLKLLLIKR